MSKVPEGKLCLKSISIFLKFKCQKLKLESDNRAKCKLYDKAVKVNYITHLRDFEVKKCSACLKSSKGGKNG